MKLLLRLLCTLLLLAALGGEAWARGASSGGGSFGGGGGSSRSSSSSGSSSRSSSGSSFSSGRSSGSSSWGSGRTSSGSGGGTRSSSSSWGSSSRFSPSSSGSTRSSSTDTSNTTQRSAPSSSATDSALARKVGQGGSTFSSRSEAVSDFQQKYADQYKSTFRNEPSTRPDYIPSRTTINGGNYDVTYNSGYGGYGSMVGNRWMAYSALGDAVMLNALMNRHNYSYGGGYGGGYYGSDPGYGGRTEYYASQSPGGSGAGLVFIVILVIGGIVVVQYLKSRTAIQANPFSGGGTRNLTGVPPPAPLRNLKTSPMDKSKAEDWLAVNPNSVVTVSDAQGIADSMKRGLGVRGIDYTVRSIGRLTHVNGLSTHLFFTLHDEEQVTYLLVKIVDDLIDLGLYFEVDGLAPGSRQDLVDRGALWLFQEPANAQRFNPSELRYTTNIRQTLPAAGGGQEEVFYELKPQGELQCNYRETPPRSGMAQEALGTVVEYRTSQTVENPEFLILEIGERRSAQSWVQFYLGCPVKFSEVDVLPV